MIKKTITYKDYEGKERTEDFYFNLSQAELAEMELVNYKTGFAQKIQAIVDSEDGRAIMDLFKSIIKDSYGVRTEDGRSFIKTEEAYLAFAGTEAYSQLFMELVTNGTQASFFINGLLPSDLAAKAKEAEAKAGFRPGAQTLPQSRLDQLAAQQAKEEELAKIHETLENQAAATVAEANANEAQQMNNSSGYQEAEARAPQQFQATIVPTTPEVPQFRENLPENGGSTTVAPIMTPEELAAWRAQQSQQ